MACGTRGLQASLELVVDTSSKLPSFSWAHCVRGWDLRLPTKPVYHRTALPCRMCSGLASFGLASSEQLQLAVNEEQGQTPNERSKIPKAKWSSGHKMMSYSGKKISNWTRVIRARLASLHVSTASPPSLLWVCTKTSLLLSYLAGTKSTLKLIRIYELTLEFDNHGPCQKNNV